MILTHKHVTVQHTSFTRRIQKHQNVVSFRTNIFDGDSPLHALTLPGVVLLFRGGGGISQQLHEAQAHVSL